MTFGRISAPIDDEIRFVFCFTQCACYLAAQLSGDFRRTMSQRCVTVEQPAKQVCQRHTLALGFTRCVAHAVYQRHVGCMKMRRRCLDGFVQAVEPRLPSSSEDQKQNTMVRRVSISAIAAATVSTIEVPAVLS